MTDEGWPALPDPIPSNPYDEDGLTCGRHRRTINPV